MTLPRPIVGVSLAFATAGISGVSVFVNAAAVRSFGEPALYTTAKNLVAALLLVAVLALATRVRSSGLGAGLTMPSGRREWLGLIAVGIFGGGIPFLLFFEGLARASSSDAAFIHKTLVVWVAILAVAFLRERFTQLHAAAIGLLILGQVVTATGLQPRLEVASVLILAATLLWAVEVVVAKALLRRLSPLTLGAARMSIGVVVLAAFAVASGAVSRLGGVDGAAWLWVLATGVILAGYVGTWYAALSRARAIDVSAVLVFGAVITAVIDRGIASIAVAPPAGLVLITVGAAAIALVALRSREAAA